MEFRASCIVFWFELETSGIGAGSSGFSHKEDDGAGDPLIVLLVLFALETLFPCFQAASSGQT